MARIPVAQRRRDFIHAAVDVIASHGIDGATTRKIAEQAKANVAMLHYCYDSKEDLFADVFTHVAGEYTEVIENSGVQANVTDTAVNMLRAVMTGYLNAPDFAAATLELISWARRQHGDQGIGVYDRAFTAGRDVLSQAGAAEGLDDAAAEEILYVIATLADGFAVNWTTHGDHARAEKQMDLNCSVLESWMASHRLTPQVKKGSSAKSAKAAPLRRPAKKATARKRAPRS